MTQDKRGISFGEKLVMAVALLGGLILLLAAFGLPKFLWIVAGIVVLVVAGCVAVSLFGEAPPPP